MRVESPLLLESAGAKRRGIIRCEYRATKAMLAR